MKKILNIISALSVIILISAFGAWYYTTGGKEIYLNDYTGEHISKVYDFCAANGLKFTLTFAESVKDKNLVLSQSVANISVKPGRRVNFTVSKGKAVLSVPDLIGKNFREFLSARRGPGRKFKIGNIYKINAAENIPENTVLFQNPLPGAIMKADEPVNFVLSSPPALKIPAPDFTNLRFEQIPRALADLGFKTGDIKYNISAEEYVIQYPQAGSLIAKDEPLNFMFFLNAENYKKYFRKYFEIIYVLKPSMDSVELAAVKNDETGRTVILKEFYEPAASVSLSGHITGRGYIDIFENNEHKKRYNF